MSNSIDKKQAALKEVSIAYAQFLDEDCIRSFKGWLLRDPLTEYDGTEFQLDELYDYWREKILSESAEG